MCSVLGALVHKGERRRLREGVMRSTGREDDTACVNLSVEKLIPHYNLLVTLLLNLQGSAIVHLMCIYLA